MPKINQRLEHVKVNNEGELLNYDRNISYNIGSEPPYVKVYLETILYLKDLPKGYNPVLMCILKRLPWASQEQGIAINAALKRIIAKEVECSVSRVDHAITDFVKGELLYRMDTGLYRVNPNLFGRGEWSDIAKLRLEITFDSHGKTFMGEIDRKNKSGEVKTEKLEKQICSTWNDDVSGRRQQVAR